MRGGGFYPYYGAKSCDFNSRSAYLDVKPWGGEKLSVPHLLQRSWDTEHCSLFLACRNGSDPAGRQARDRAASWLIWEAKGFFWDAPHL